MALISVADSFNILWYSAWYFSPLSCNYRRVANSLLPGGTGQKALQLRPVPFHKAEVKCVVLAAQLGTCHLTNAEAVQELLHALLQSPGPARCPKTGLCSLAVEETAAVQRGARPLLSRRG